MSKRILVVEDDELNRRLLHDMLWSQGYETIETENGRTAFELAREQKPDLMLVDMQLPVMSGLELTRRIKADAELGVTPIVAITAFALRADEARIRASGCDAYVTKPFSIKNLLGVIERHIEDDGKTADDDETPPQPPVADDVQKSAPSVETSEEDDSRRDDQASASSEQTVDDRPPAAIENPADVDSESGWTIAETFSTSSEPPPVPSEPSDGSQQTSEPVALTAAQSPLAGATLLFAIAFAANALWPTSLWRVRDTDLYLVDFPGGASGLTAGSDVRHAGVNIGQVMRVEVDERRPGAARVVLRIDSGAAIRDRAVAKVRQEHIIGSAYLDLRNRARASDILQRQMDPSAGTARAMSAHIHDAIEDLPRFLERAALMMEAVAQTAARPDLRALSRSLDELGILMAMLARNSDRIDELLADSEISLQSIRSAADRLRDIAHEIEIKDAASPGSPTTLDALRAEGGVLERSLLDLHALAREVDGGLHEISRNGRAELMRLLEEARGLTGLLASIAEETRSASSNDEPFAPTEA
jgi:two-component system cell cycle response regulator DivK